MWKRKPRTMSEILQGAKKAQNGFFFFFFFYLFIGFKGTLMQI